jgi:hypothetical protein
MPWRRGVSTLTSLARAHAVLDGRAQRITTVRHLHVAHRPLVFIPLAMAGEANAPLAALIGDSVGAPQLFVVAQPRDRGQRFTFAHELGLVLLQYVGSFMNSPETISSRRRRTERVRYADAPQIWVPNRPGIEFLRLLGRSTRFRSTNGEYAVPITVPTLGKWLTLFAERSEYAGCALTVAATEALSQHWATGQSSIEDGNLATTIAWINPPARMSGAAAAAAAEDAVTSPPAGPATDPSFDNEVLAPTIREYGRAADSATRRRVVEKLESALRGQLEPTWQLMWYAIEQLRVLPPGAHVNQRWAEDRQAYSDYTQHLAADGRPQPKQDSAVAAAVRLNKLERQQATYNAQCALDDPLVMAEYRLTGEAFVGTVIDAQLDRRVGTGRSRVLRPLVTVHTTDPVRLSIGQDNLRDGVRAMQTAEVITITSIPDGLHVVLELAGGMGRGRIPPPGSVPEPGDQVCYSTLTDNYQPRGVFPTRDNTPWTHGGPPPEPVPAQNDAAEVWL